MHLFANGDDFISRVFDLNKGLFGLLVQLAASLDVFNKPSGKQAQADRINL
jgi:hypothetical protein